MPTPRTVLSPVGTLLAAVVLAVVVAGVSLTSVQAALTLVALLAVLGVYLHAPGKAMLLVWALWLVVPGVRRLFTLLGPLPATDPLSVLPFLAVGVVGVLEALRLPPTRRTRRIALAAGAGLFVGVPLGLANPQGLIFAGLAYGSAVLGIFIGYAEGRVGRFTLRTVLLTGGPVIALYGVLQYFSLPSWDVAWLDTVQLISIGDPATGHVRVFSTLNSPGPFAAVLALALLCVLAAPRFTAASAAVALPLLAALALTYVRGAWVSLLLAAVAALLLLRGPAARRLLVLTSVGVALLFAFGASPAGRQFSDRVSSVQDTNSDVSANARLDRMRLIAPAATSSPAGKGLGQAGVATSLTADRGATGSAGDDPQRDTDNGILSLVLQTGPLGAALVLAALLAALGTAIRSASSTRRDPTDALVAVLLIFIVSQELFGDALYGVTGSFAWYLAGLALGRAGPTAPRSIPHG